MGRKTAGLNVVVDGKITDEALGLIQRKANDAARRVESGSRTLDEILEGFQGVLEGSVPGFGIWKTVEIGRYKNIEELREALRVSDIRVSEWADDVLGKVKLSKSRQTLELVLLSPSDLGYPQGGMYESICRAGLARGFELCPPELAAYLCLLPIGEVGWHVMAMEAIKDSGGDPSVFLVRCCGVGRWLFALIGFPVDLWGDSSRFVFVRCK
jgi:hypothetical protein